MNIKEQGRSSAGIAQRTARYFGRVWTSFSFTGLAIATLFFAASLSPSLLPRNYVVQGLLSGLAIAVGYGLGVSMRWLFQYLEIPSPHDKIERAIKWTTTLGAAVAVLIALWRATVWQNSIRGLMEMEPLESAYPTSVALIAATFGIVLIGLARLLQKCGGLIDKQLSRILPRRVSNALSVLLVAILVLLITNKLIARRALNFADNVFLEIDQRIDDGLEQPTHDLATGGSESLIQWDAIGRRGRDFIATGPSQEELKEFSGREAMQPLRVYAGLSCGKTAKDRAQLALEELKRVGGFNRSILIVATPTGTGWLDPGAVDTIEFLHAGDTAIVSLQYSYLPSWITILVEPDSSRKAANVLFDAIYGHWRSLPSDQRPRLYLHGLSLGALGSETSADLFTLFEDPIHGGLWSGPPFPSTEWASVTGARNPDSPAWLPRFRDGSMVRFTGKVNRLADAGERWGPMRFVYLQHASDPMTFFAPELLYQRPAWLIGKRGPDVSPYLDWRPILTFMQVGFDLPMATSVPSGYGHNFAPGSYIDAWIEVTNPPNWNAEQTERLKQHFQDRQEP